MLFRLESGYHHPSFPSLHFDGFGMHVLSFVEVLTAGCLSAGSRRGNGVVGFTVDKIHGKNGMTRCVNGLEE